jgi:hypothetical protein
MAGVFIAPLKVPMWVIVSRERNGKRERVEERERKGEREGSYPIVYGRGQDILWCHVCVLCEACVQRKTTINHPPRLKH